MTRRLEEEEEEAEEEEEGSDESVRNVGPLQDPESCGTGCLRRGAGHSRGGRQIKPREQITQSRSEQKLWMTDDLSLGLSCCSHSEFVLETSLSSQARNGGGDGGGGGDDRKGRSAWGTCGGTSQASNY